MSVRSRTSPPGSPLPPTRADAWLTLEELARTTGVSASTIVRLERLGLIEPAGGDAHQFAAAAAIRLRRMLRLHHDLELDLFATEIIAELLDRLDTLESELTRLREGRG
jgi:DNA-binding transcriptional MerR regulator